jgi:hypothetical protein
LWRINSSDRAIALAIAGILIAIVLAILAAVQASSNAIVICGGVTFVLIVVLYVPALHEFYRVGREQFQRWSLQKRRGLRLVRNNEADTPPSRLPDKVYGYEEIFAVAGLRSWGAHADAARIKPDRTNKDGSPYPLEVHKFDGETWLVGYVAPQSRALAETATESGELILWMRRTKANHALVEIPLGRVTEEKSLGDRSSIGSAKNLFRLFLRLTAEGTTEGELLRPPWADGFPTRTRKPA